MYFAHFYFKNLFRRMKIMALRLIFIVSSLASAQYLAYDAGASGRAKDYSIGHAEVMGRLKSSVTTTADNVKITLACKDAAGTVSSAAGKAITYFYNSVDTAKIGTNICGSKNAATASPTATAPAPSTELTDCSATTAAMANAGVITCEVTDSLNLKIEDITDAGHGSLTYEFLNRDSRCLDTGSVYNVFMPYGAAADSWNTTGSSCFDRNLTYVNTASRAHSTPNVESKECVIDRALSPSYVCQSAGYRF